MAAGEDAYLVGAPARDGSGVVYAYQAVDGLWDEAQLIPSQRNVGDGFGASIAHEGQFVLIGAPGYDDPVDDAGLTYVFEFPGPNPIQPYGFGDGSSGPCPCANEVPLGVERGCENSTGLGANLKGTGSTSLSVADILFRGKNLPPGQAALLFAGSAPATGVPFGDGLRVVGGGLTRLGIRYVASHGGVEWGAEVLGLGGWSSGETAYFQIWYRDPVGGPCGSAFNLSSGLRVIFEN